MRRSLLLALAVIVLGPLAILGWLAARLAGEERVAAESRTRQVLASSIAAFDATIHGVMEEERTQVVEQLENADLAPDALRALARRLPQARQLFALVPDGTLAYPSLMDDLSSDESAFLRRTREVWTEGLLLPSEGKGSAIQESAATKIPAAPRGFHVLDAGHGLHLLTWWRRADGRTVGMEMDGVRLLSRIVAALPDTAAQSSERGRYRLVDAAGTILHQWGPHEPAAGAAPLLQLSLAPPLGSWSLQYLSPPLPTAPSLLPAGSLPWLALLLIVILCLATYFYRESSRDMREASSRVTFVNQVSHELKTPLTNIRMYAELLAEQVEEGSVAERHAAVIASESQRLSRLILNILTFNKSQRRELSVTPKAGVVDDVIGETISQFRPALEQAGIEARFAPGAPGPCTVDGDALGQILVNLLNNVEKYAAGGGHVDVASAREGENVLVTVSDGGPGIPESERERVFAPFHRLSNALSDGVTGTGIGLAIARELARRHGGDLVVVPADVGACFRLTLQAPLTKEPS